MIKHIQRISLVAGSVTSAAIVAFTSSAASALSTKTANTAGATPVTTNGLQNIISKGNQEITRRLTTLNSLSGKISSATKLTSNDSSTLSNEVSTEVSGLTALKAKLDAETTAAGARADVQSMISEYRVYLLVVPKVELVKQADDQQVVESKLMALAQKLQTRINAAKNAGKDVATMQTQLADMTAKTTAAQGISSSIETSIIGLQPSDYDSNHSVLSGDKGQLQTAHQGDQAAYTDAKAIVQALQ